METKTNHNIHKLFEEHGCLRCYEINKGYITTEDGHHICKVCGGTVLLGIQSVFDYVAHLKAMYGELE